MDSNEKQMITLPSGDICKKIRNRRKALKIPVCDIAKELGVSIATVYRYESSGIENMKLKKVTELLTILGLTLWDLAVPKEKKKNKY